VSYHHAIAIVGGAHRHCGGKLCAELASPDEYSAPHQLLPRLVTLSFFPDSANDRRRSSEPGRNQRCCSEPASWKFCKVLSFHLFPQFWCSGELVKDQIYEKLAKHHQVHAGPRRRIIHGAR